MEFHATLQCHKFAENRIRNTNHEVQCILFQMIYAEIINEDMSSSGIWPAYWIGLSDQQGDGSVVSMGISTELVFQCS